jgi:hypothetical protein
VSERILKILGILGGILLGLFVVGFYIGLGYLIYNYWRVAYELVRDALDLGTASYTRASFFGFVSFIIGIALFQLRSIARIHYGLLEIMFGVLSVVASTSPLSQSGGGALQILQVGAGIYIVVRGLDNLKIGLDKEPTDSAWAPARLLFLPLALLIHVK